MAKTYTLQLNDHSEEVLEQLADEKQTTEADVLREALAFSEFFHNLDEGERVCVVDEDGDEVKEVIAITR